ncbi:MAG: CoA-binding protein [Dehalococcoidales bacterium]|nr:CoA-binding protein [Dehalococcoidales bacterium]
MKSIEAGTDSVRMFFEPESVAVVGASRTPGKLGNTILKNLIYWKYPGEIFPVNPKPGDILGLPAYTSVSAIPRPVELAVIAIPIDHVLEVTRECAARGVRGLVIITSGFNEVGAEGNQRLQELLRIARGAGMRIVGPNTTGIVNPYHPFTTTFVELGEVRKGSIAFIAQTGMFAGLMLQRIMTAEDFGLSKVAGLGNKADIADHDILEYLAQDRNTRAIMMYIEGVKDGRRFYDAARRLTKIKPITAMKIGRTPAGAKAAMSHTGSLTGSDEVFDDICRQAGIIRAYDFDELIDFAKMFAYQPIPRSTRTAVVTLSMGAGALASDFCYESGLQLAELKPETLAKVARKSPAWVKLTNPLDIETMVELVGPGEGYQTAVAAALADENVDQCLIVLGTVLTTGADVQFLEAVQKAHPQKSITVCVLGSKGAYEQLCPAIEKFQIPVFPSVRRAVKGLAALNHYRQFNRP